MTGLLKKAHLARVHQPPVKKPSKAPIYAEAFKQFIESDLSIIQIANGLGLRPDTLVKLAENQQWYKRRSVLRTQISVAESDERAALAARTDATLVSATSKNIVLIARHWEEMTEKVLALEIEPNAKLTEPTEVSRDLAWQLERKIALMTKVSVGYSAMIETAASLGLVKGMAKEAKAGDVDLSKLTQLNILINQAVENKGEKTVEPLELEESESLIE